MNTVLIVTGAPGAGERLAELLPRDRYEIGECTDRGGTARRLLDARTFDLVIINPPLPDESGEALAAHVADTSDAGVLLLVNAGAAEETGERLGERGVLIIPKPVNRTFFAGALRLTAAAKNALARARRENGRLQDKIAELKKIDRAKYVLIGVLGMDEPQAHRYLEKQAMDLRISRAEIAERILKTYET